MNNKRKTICATLNYIVYFLILGSTVTRRISISVFDSLLGIPIKITSSAIGLKNWATTEVSEKHESIIKKKNRKHIKTALLATSKLNNIETLISKALINSSINHD